MRIGEHLNAEADLMVFDEHDATGQDTFALMTPREKQAWDSAFAEENAAYRRNPPSGRDRVKWNYQRYIKNYLRCVASIDDSVGRMLDYLDTHGLTENTMVIYTSDQGFYLGEHGWYDKRFMYEPSLRAPCLIQWSREISSGSVCGQIVSNVDIAPTLLEVAGRKVPADIQGSSLIPVLRRQSQKNWRTSFYYHFYEGPPYAHTVAEHEGVTTGVHKLIHFYVLNEWELYELTQDPNELRNRYGDRPYAEVQAQLHAALVDARHDLKVPPNE